MLRVLKLAAKGVALEAMLHPIKIFLAVAVMYNTSDVSAASTRYCCSSSVLLNRVPVISSYYTILPYHLGEISWVGRCVETFCWSTQEITNPWFHCEICSHFAAVIEGGDPGKIVTVPRTQVSHVS